MLSVPVTRVNVMIIQAQIVAIAAIIPRIKMIGWF
jgi:hypothetical protein